MPFALFRHMKLTHLLRLGFGLMLLCIVATFTANIVVAKQYQENYDHLNDHLYPALQSAQFIVWSVQTIDEDGARYILSHDSHQQAQLLQSYQQDVQALRTAVARSNTLADTPQQRTALADFMSYFFGSGGYYAENDASFVLKRAGQELTAEDNYVESPFLSLVQQDIQLYTNVVQSEIKQAGARQDALSNMMSFINFGVGGSAVLSGLAIAILITKAIQRLYQELEEKNTRLQAQSTTDSLTELPNQRALISTLKQELERSQRSGQPCSLLFLDLDHFKAINDSYGHATGDIVLRNFADVLRTTTRSIDTVGRWGGEEFVIILHEANTGEAMEIAERIRAAVSFHTFGGNKGLYLTCSIGIASYPEHGYVQEALISAADHAMYGAKRLGRNQVRVISDPAVTALLNKEAVEGGREEIALRGTVEALVALVEERDRLLGDHSKQVSDLVYQLACNAGMTLSEAQSAALAGLLHDIGKVAIPDAILQKAGPLTDEEWVQMRRHSIVGAEVLDRIPSLHPLAPVIRAHHEHWNGQGYPDHLKAEQIPLAARLIGVVDSYLVMTTDRPYQHARTQAEALTELRRCAGTQFDPHIVESLIELLQKTQEQQQREVLHVA